MQIQYMHCDNADNNVAFKKACKQEGLGVDLRYTAPGMPQQMGHVEQKFTTLFNKVLAVLNGGKFNTLQQNGIWAEATNIALLLENMF